jgi:acyl-CoA thioester hydrolase
MTTVKILSATTEMQVKFHECDPLGIVWHGNYLKYFEEGREGFGKAYGIDFMEVYRKGYATPLVHSDCYYKRPLRYQDYALVETTLRYTEAAKVIFDYVIRNKATQEVVCTGSTTQVFVTGDKMELSLVTPDFIKDWLSAHQLP